MYVFMCHSLFFIIVITLGVLLLEPFGWGSYGGQGHLPLVPFLELLGRTYKVICFLVATCAGHGVAWEGHKLGPASTWARLVAP